MRKTAIDHRQTNVGFQGNIAERTRAIPHLALFDRGHCLAGHPSEGGDFLFEGDRSIRARFLGPAGARDRVPVVQRLGRARGRRLRHAGRLVQPLRPAPGTPSRRAGFRDQDARRTAGIAGEARLSAARLPFRLWSSQRSSASGELEVLEVVLEGGDGVIVDSERIPLKVGDRGVGRSRREVVQKVLRILGLRLSG